MKEEEINEIKKAWIPNKSLTKIINKKDYYIEDDAFIHKNEFLDCSFTGSVENAELKQNLFTKCSFEKFKMRSFLINNIIFDKSYTLNTIIKDSKIIRTEFNNSKLLGMTFDTCSGNDITFLNSNCQFVNFRKTQFKRTIFENCILREADFQGADLRGVIFNNCDLREAEFSFAILDGVNFCNSRIEGIKIQSNTLHGAVVDYHQAAYLGAKYLGLKIN